MFSLTPCLAVPETVESDSTRKDIWAIIVPVVVVFSVFVAVLAAR